MSNIEHRSRNLSSRLTILPHHTVLPPQLLQRPCIISDSVYHCTLLFTTCFFFIDVHRFFIDNQAAHLCIYFVQVNGRAVLIDSQLALVLIKKHFRNFPNESFENYSISYHISNTSDKSQSPNDRSFASFLLYGLN